MYVSTFHSLIVQSPLSEMKVVVPSLVILVTHAEYPNNISKHLSVLVSNNVTVLSLDPVKKMISLLFATQLTPIVCSMNVLILKITIESMWKLRLLN